MNQSSVLDIRRFSSIFKSDIEVVDLALAVLPRAGCCIGDSLDAGLAKLHLKRLLTIMVQLERIDQGTVSEKAKMYLRILHTASDDLLRKYVTSPCVSGVLYKVRDWTSLRQVIDGERILKMLGNAMLDLVLCSRASFHGKISLRASARGRIELPLCGTTLCISGIAITPELEVVVNDREIDILDQQVTSLGRLSLDCRANPIPSGVRFEPLTRIANSSITLVRDAADLYELYPQDDSKFQRCLADDETSIFVDALNGLALVRRHWIEGYDEVIDTIHRVLPLESDGTLNPRNESVHELRGLVATTPRPSYLAAQMWMHESGHNRFSTILDLYDILPPCGELFFSPFVQRLRPPNALLHGIFSFIRDMEITRRLRGQVDEIPGYSMERYFQKNLEKLRAAMDTVRTQFQPTPMGARLVEGFEHAIQRLSQC